MRLNIKKELMEKTNKTNKTESDGDETRIVILVLSSCLPRRKAKKKVSKEEGEYDNGHDEISSDT